MHRILIHGKWLVVGAACSLTVLAGCGLGESVVDGVFGGVSDTIAAAISMVALRFLGIDTA